ncbi:sulfotransferase family protein [Salinibacillus xinjiangensis]|uniref:Sulfotransferase n=1 Tax=Salinibacillus xinjiangensis TaxID=1229268 RepID=A0A6G1X1A7_9BACI|nr:sulfotransferase [Salinibacillus xinjiangensis]MRG84777.1 hypothetical protein [Salinibacillus xinjiangensis]
MENVFPPIFIGGSGRSGTTLLVDMLGLHKDLSPIYETDFVSYIIDLFYRSSKEKFYENKLKYRKYVEQWSELLPQRPHNKQTYERYVHGPHYINFSKQEMRDVTDKFLSELTLANIDKSVITYLNELFSLHSKNDNKLCWVNKTPAYVNYSEQLLKWFPNMKFIHIIRDGRDVALSVRDRIGPKDFSVLADWWMNQVLLGMSFGRKHPHNYIEVKYEDLILTPSKTLNFIFNSLRDSNQRVDNNQLEDIIEQSYDLNESMIGKWKAYPYQEEIFEFTTKSNTLLQYLEYGGISKNV